MPELQRLNASHAPAILAFELANRADFAAFVSDRGDEFFGQFAERHSDLLAEQEAGTDAFYVLVAEDGSIRARHFGEPCSGGMTASAPRPSEPAGRSWVRPGCRPGTQYPAPKRCSAA